MDISQLLKQLTTEHQRLEILSKQFSKVPSFSCVSSSFSSSESSSTPISSPLPLSTLSAKKVTDIKEEQEVEWERLDEEDPLYGREHLKLLEQQVKACETCVAFYQDNIHDALQSMRDRLKRLHEVLLQASLSAPSSRHPTSKVTEQDAYPMEGEKKETGDSRKMEVAVGLAISSVWYQTAVVFLFLQSHFLPHIIRCMSDFTSCVHTGMSRRKRRMTTGEGMERERASPNTTTTDSSRTFSFFMRQASDVSHHPHEENRVVGTPSSVPLHQYLGREVEKKEAEWEEGLWVVCRIFHQFLLHLPRVLLTRLRLFLAAPCSSNAGNGLAESESSGPTEEEEEEEQRRKARPSGSCLSSADRLSSSSSSSSFSIFPAAPRPAFSEPSKRKVGVVPCEDDTLLLSKFRLSSSRVAQAKEEAKQQEKPLLVSPSSPIMEAPTILKTPLPHPRVAYTPVQEGKQTKTAEGKRGSGQKCENRTARPLLASSSRLYVSLVVLSSSYFPLLTSLCSMAARRGPSDTASRAGSLLHSVATRSPFLVSQERMEVSSPVTHPSPLPGLEHPTLRVPHRMPQPTTAEERQKSKERDGPHLRYSTEEGMRPSSFVASTSFSSPSSTALVDATDTLVPLLGQILNLYPRVFPCAPFLWLPPPSPTDVVPERMPEQEIKWAKQLGDWYTHTANPNWTSDSSSSFSRLLLLTPWATTTTPSSLVGQRTTAALGPGGKRVDMLTLEAFARGLRSRTPSSSATALPPASIPGGPEAIPTPHHAFEGNPLMRSATVIPSPHTASKGVLASGETPANMGIPSEEETGHSFREEYEEELQEFEAMLKEFFPPPLSVPDGSARAEATPDEGGPSSAASLLSSSHALHGVRKKENEAEDEAEGVLHHRSPFPGRCPNTNDTANPWPSSSLVQEGLTEEEWPSFSKDEAVGEVGHGKEKKHEIPVEETLGKQEKTSTHFHAEDLRLNGFPDDLAAHSHTGEAALRVQDDGRGEEPSRTANASVQDSSSWWWSFPASEGSMESAWQKSLLYTKDAEEEALRIGIGSQIIEYWDGPVGTLSREATSRSKGKGGSNALGRRPRYLHRSWRRHAAVFLPPSSRSTTTISRGRPRRVSREGAAKEVAVGSPVCGSACASTSSSSILCHSTWVDMPSTVPPPPSGNGGEGAERSPCETTSAHHERPLTSSLVGPAPWEVPQTTANQSIDDEEEESPRGNGKHSTSRVWPSPLPPVAKEVALDGALTSMRNRKRKRSPPLLGNPSSRWRVAEEKKGSRTTAWAKHRVCEDFLRERNENDETSEHDNEDDDDEALEEEYEETEEEEEEEEAPFLRRQRHLDEYWEFLCLLTFHRKCRSEKEHALPPPPEGSGAPVQSPSCVSYTTRSASQDKASSSFPPTWPTSSCFSSTPFSGSHSCDPSDWLFQLSFSSADAALRQTVVKAIEELGGRVIGSPSFHPACTHLILGPGHLERSEKYLCACAAGVLMFPAEYVLECRRQGRGWLCEREDLQLYECSPTRAVRRPRWGALASSASPRRQGEAVGCGERRGLGGGPAGGRHCGARGGVPGDRGDWSGGRMPVPSRRSTGLFLAWKVILFTEEKRVLHGIRVVLEAGGCSCVKGLLYVRRKPDHGRRRMTAGGHGEVERARADDAFHHVETREKVGMGEDETKNIQPYDDDPKRERCDTLLPGSSSSFPCTTSQKEHSMFLLLDDEDAPEQHDEVPPSPVTTGEHLPKMGTAGGHPLLPLTERTPHSVSHRPSSPVRLVCATELCEPQHTDNPHGPIPLLQEATHILVESKVFSSTSPSHFEMPSWMPAELCENPELYAKMFSLDLLHYCLCARSVEVHGGRVFDDDGKLLPGALPDNKCRLVLPASVGGRVL